jgi:hypothetical protein
MLSGISSRVRTSGKINSREREGSASSNTTSNGINNINDNGDQPTDGNSDREQAGHNDKMHSTINDSRRYCIIGVHQGFLIILCMS